MFSIEGFRQKSENYKPINPPVWSCSSSSASLSFFSVLCIQAFILPGFLRPRVSGMSGGRLSLCKSCPVPCLSYLSPPNPLSPTSSPRPADLVNLDLWSFVYVIFSPFLHCYFTVNLCCATLYDYTNDLLWFCKQHCMCSICEPSWAREESFPPHLKATRRVPFITKQEVKDN